MELSWLLVLIASAFVQSSVIPDGKFAVSQESCINTWQKKLLPMLVDGNPEYDIQSLEPIKLDDIKFNMSGLEFSLSDATSRGIKKIIFDECNWNTDEKTIKSKFHTNTSLTGHYTAGGNALGVPIAGDGDIKIKLKYIEFITTFYYDIIKINGNDHIKIQKYKFDFDVKDGAQYELTNLFNGNKELSDAVLKFANENWHDMAISFGRPLIDVVAREMTRQTNKFLKNIPLADFYQS